MVVIDDTRVDMFPNLTYLRAARVNGDARRAGAAAWAAARTAGSSTPVGKIYSCN